jgi:hypothetical protein
MMDAKLKNRITPRRTIRESAWPRPGMIAERTAATAGETKPGLISFST